MKFKVNSKITSFYIIHYSVELQENTKCLVIISTKNSLIHFSRKLAIIHLIIHGYCSIFTQIHIYIPSILIKWQKGLKTGVSKKSGEKNGTHKNKFYQIFVCCLLLVWEGKKDISLSFAFMLNMYKSFSHSFTLIQGC